MPRICSPRRPLLHHVLIASITLAAFAALRAPAAAAPAQGEPERSDPPSIATSTTDPSTTTEPSTDLGCDAVLHDTRGSLQGSTEVGAAVLRLAAEGVHLRVRSEDRLPVTGEVAELQASCAGWAVEGERVGRAVWLFLDVPEGRAALWYGAELRSRIGARFHRVRSEVLDEGVPAGPAAVAALLDRLRTLVAAPEPPEDPFGCDALLWDPARLLVGTDAEDAAFALQGEGGDVHVRVEGPSDGDIDRRIGQLDEVCAGWSEDGERPDRQLVVMVQPSARSTGIWYGRWWDDRLEDRWEDLQAEDMNPRFRNGDYDGGLAAGLRHMGSERRWRYQLPEYEPPQGWSSRDRDSGDDGSMVWPFLVVLAMMGIGWGISYLTWRSKYESGETTLSWSEYRGQSSGGSRWRPSGGRSSWGGGGGGGGRRSSGGGGGRSSGGGRRSGGGSSRW